MFRSLYLRQLDGDARAFGLGYLLLLPLYLAPLFVARYLPGLDLPFHLSMADMLGKAGDPNSPYAGHYLSDLSVAPYAAHYLALRVLGTFMPLMAAHKLIIALYVTALPLGAAWLLDTCGRSRVPALLAFPLAYNLTLHYGFISFALSLPVLLFMLAALVRFLVDDHMRPGLGVATGLLAVTLFLCHLQNFLFGLCAAAVCIALARVEWRRRLLGLATLVPSVVCLLAWHFTRDFSGPAGVQKKSLAHAWQVVKAERLSDMGVRPVVEDLWSRLNTLPVHLLRGFVDNIDIWAARGLLVVIVGYMAVAILGMSLSAAGEPRPRMRIAGWLLLAGALTAYLGMPHHLREFELMTFYPRFAVLVMAMALLAIPASLRRLDGVGRVIVVVPALALGALYADQLIRHYRYYDKEVADFSAIIQKVPPGGRTAGLVFDRTSRVMRIESALVGLPHLYPALRPAPGSMTPVFYCGMRHMPCKKLPAKASIPDPGPWGPHLFSAAAGADFFDYLLVRLPPGRPLFGSAHDRFQLLAKEGSWLAYKVQRPATPPPAAKPAAAPAAPTAAAIAPERVKAPKRQPLKAPAARRAGRALKSPAAQTGKVRTAE
jgi:hypothetical protein